MTERFSVSQIGWGLLTICCTAMEIWGAGAGELWVFVVIWGLLLS